MINQIIPPEGSTERKQEIWKFNTAPKIKHFLWRLLSNVLVVGSTLIRRGITNNAQCRRCCQGTETTEHLFFTCPYAEMIWRGAQLPHYRTINRNVNFEDRFWFIIDIVTNTEADSVMRQMPLWIFWRLWKSRNLLLYQQQSRQ